MNNIAVFASGAGTNAENITRYFFDSKIAKVKLILTENPNALVISKGNKLGVPTHIFTVKELNTGLVKKVLIREKIHLIVLAGFLKLIPSNLIEAFPNRIVNIHPALLPKFGGKGMYGMNVHRAVLESEEFESGITVHYVNSKYDAGDIIFQAKCPVIPCDKAETLAERVHALEYEYYPKVIERLIEKG